MNWCTIARQRPSEKSGSASKNDRQQTNETRGS